MHLYPHISGILTLGLHRRICAHEFDLVSGLNLNAGDFKTALLIGFPNLRRFV